MSDKVYKGAKKKKKGLSRKRIAEGVIIGILVAGALTLITFLVAWATGGGDGGGGDGGPSASNGTPATSEPSNLTPTTATPTLTTSSPAATQLSAPKLETFDISLERVSWGKDIGPERYQLSDRNGKVYVIYSWDAVMSDGTENDGESCEIVGSVSGPQRLESYLTNECSYGGGSSIGNPNETVLDISVPGDYTVTVEDKITGTTGSATFQVIE